MVVGAFIPVVWGGFHFYIALKKQEKLFFAASVLCRRSFWPSIFERLSYFPSGSSDRCCEDYQLVLHPDY